MINFIEKNNKLNLNLNSLNVTYPRTVNIIFGNYPYPEKIHNFIVEIKNNLDPKLKNITNVKGNMTDWYYFLKNENFSHLITYLINKYQISHPEIFQYFFEKLQVTNAWGNEIKTGDSLNFHTHNCYHGILYLTEGCELELPELNIKINPNPGDYYLLPPFVLHGFNKSLQEKNRYSLIFNIHEKNSKFNFLEKYERKNS